MFLTKKFVVVCLENNVDIIDRKFLILRLKKNKHLVYNMRVLGPLWFTLKNVKKLNSPKPIDINNSHILREKNGKTGKND